MTINQILNNIDESVSLKLIAQAYTEIASSRLKKIRSEVERNRTFFDDISKIYQIVKHIAYKHNVRPIQKNNKTISIVLTSNYRFYGGINDELMRFFIVHTSKIPTDKLVIGKAGITFLQAIDYTHSYTPLSLKKDLPSAAEINDLGIKIRDYSQVIVYYSKMETVLLQKATFKDITQSSNLTSEEIAAANDLPDFLDLLFHPQSIGPQNTQEDFLFEPDVVKMLDFFENQITILLLEQAFLESELSRTASRLISMDQAQDKANQLIRQQKQLLNLAEKSLSNQHVLETAVAIEALHRLAKNHRE